MLNTPDTYMYVRANVQKLINLVGETFYDFWVKNT